MKYVVILCDGMAGHLLEELDYMSTMQVARTPMMDKISKLSEQGLAKMIPKGMVPGSDTANLAVLGYDPTSCYTGRSPLEALSLGVDLGEGDVSYRMNLVTISEDENKSFEEQTIIDHSSDEISSEDAAVLVEALKEGLKRDGYEFYNGKSYRHLMVVRNGEVVELVPPHDVLTQKIGKHLPKDETLLYMMKKSHEILKNHPLNIERRKNGLRPANTAWFWGGGTRPILSSFEEKTGKVGAMISAVDLLKGIAIGTGMRNIEVAGATGGLDTNYYGKAKAAIEALSNEGVDFVYIHIEAADEMGHQGDVRGKILAIERIDQYIVRPIFERLSGDGEDFKLLILPDHPTPITSRTHTADFVPYLLFDSTMIQQGMPEFNELNATFTGIKWKSGYKLMDYFLRPSRRKRVKEARDDVNS